MIRNVFPEDNPPKTIVGHQCERCASIESLLRGHRWTAIPSLPDPNDDRMYPLLPLLTPEALHYFLPAFLLEAIREPILEGVGLTNVLQAVLYSLCPAEKDRNFRWRKRINRFSLEQRAAIAAFLQWLHAMDEQDLFETDFWNQIPEVWR
jgi:hypothetical protein